MPLAISPVTAVAPTAYLDAAKPAGTDGSAFGTQLTGAIDNLQALSGTSNTLALQAVTGDLNDIHQATIASTRAAMTMELVASFRNKGVEALNEILRMQA